jgi:hypothetical protein
MAPHLTHWTSGARAVNSRRELTPRGSSRLSLERQIGKPCKRRWTLTGTGMGGLSLLIEAFPIAGAQRQLAAAAYEQRKRRSVPVGLFASWA